MANITVLGGLCSEIKELPTELELSGLEKDGEIGVDSGGFADIWRGKLPGSPDLVAIKAFRTYEEPDLEKAKGVSKLSKL